MLSYDELRKNLFVIAGPCAAESEELCLDIANFCSKICNKNNVKYIFKASFDKANRTSIDSYRGPGIKDGVKIFKKLKSYGYSICTDVHIPQQCAIIAPYCDIIQIPAFLARQTDLVVSAAKTNKIINIKKPQFLSSEKMKYVAEKCIKTKNKKILITERGSMFGSDDLVVDFRNIIRMKSLGFPVVMDCTHSCQTMSAGDITGGNREYAPYFAKSSIIFGANGIFSEVHPNPEEGLSDSKNMINFDSFEKMIEQSKELFYGNIC